MGELLYEALHEITAEPFIFTIEVLQFLALIFIIYRFLWPALIGKPLVERMERVNNGLKEAAEAGKVFSAAGPRAALIRKEAGEKASAIIKQARQEAVKERNRVKKAVLEETSEILAAAHRSVESEKKKIESETGEELVELISVVMRQYCDEVLNEHERRELTQKIILSKLNELENCQPEKSNKPAG